MRLILPAGLLIALCSASALLATIAVGSQFASRPLITADLRPADPACALPCWNGITPGITTRTELVERLTALAYRPLAANPEGSQSLDYVPPDLTRCRVQAVLQDEVVIRIRLQACPPTRIGDLIRLAGSPDGVIADRFALVYQGGEVLVYANRIICERRFTPETFIGMIELRTLDAPLSAIYPWRGFIDLRGYMPRGTTVLEC